MSERPPGDDKILEEAPLTPEQVLDLTIDIDLQEPMTLRQMLCELSTTLWSDQPLFDGKHYRKNSSCDLAVYKVLVVAGVIEGTLDEEGDLAQCDEIAGRDYLQSLIRKIYGLS